VLVDVPGVELRGSVSEKLQQVAGLAFGHGVTPGGDVDEVGHQSLVVDAHTEHVVLYDEPMAGALDLHHTRRRDLGAGERRHAGDGER